MKPIKYCPTCGAELTPYSLIDIHLSGLSCQNKHYFYETNKDVLSVDSLRVKEIKKTASKNKNDLELIEYWLTEKEARSVINDQIAVILRRIYEIIKEQRHIHYEKSVFVLCPICRGKLETFKQPDVWVEGLKCNNSHKYYERGDTIRFKVHDILRNLSKEMSDETVLFLVDGWLKENSLSDTQLHDDMKRIMKKYKKQMETGVSALLNK